MAACVNMKYYPKTHLNDDIVENQFQIALIIHRSIDKKKSKSSSPLKSFKTRISLCHMKWHRLTCYLNWAILIGDPVGLQHCF